MTDLFAPAQSAVGAPFMFLSDMARTASHFTQLKAENDQLKAENERLQDWYEKAQALTAENISLRNLLNFRPEPEVKSLTARVVADSGGAYVRSLLIDAGLDEGVRKNQAAMGGRGLVGRVIMAGRHSARVLLITDLNSRIPVLLTGSRRRAVLAGDNGDLPQLLHLPLDYKPVPGERVVTSGEGGVFPPGLPIGAVIETASGVPRVSPLSDARALNALRLLDYDVGSGLEDDPFGPVGSRE